MVILWIMAAHFIDSVLSLWKNNPFSCINVSYNSTRMFIYSYLAITSKLLPNILPSPFQTLHSAVINLMDKTISYLYRLHWHLWLVWLGTTNTVSQTHSIKGNRIPFSNEPLGINVMHIPRKTIADLFLLNAGLQHNAF